jgi:hypothetical protein
MKEPKSAAARVDAERVVSRLLDAFKSLKTTPAPDTCSSPGEEEQQQRPAQSQEGRAKALEPVGDALSTASVDPRLVPQEECKVLDLIRGDHELIERLQITPEEIEALSKCAMFGTLTCKQHMLAILRQIREAGGPAAGGPEIGQTPLFPEPAIPEEEEGNPVPDCRKMLVRLNGAAMSEPGSLESTVRRRIPEQFGILFWTIVLVAGLAWNFLIVMSRWRNNFLTSIGMPPAQAAPSAAWYSNFDHPYILLWGEILIVVGIAVAMYLKSRKGYRRLKIRPRRSWL